MRMPMSNLFQAALNALMDRAAEMNRSLYPVIAGMIPLWLPIAAFLFRAADRAFHAIPGRPSRLCPGKGKSRG